MTKQQREKLKRLRKEYYRARKFLPAADRMLKRASRFHYQVWTRIERAEDKFLTYERKFVYE